MTTQKQIDGLEGRAEKLRQQIASLQEDKAREIAERDARRQQAADAKRELSSVQQQLADAQKDLAAAEAAPAEVMAYPWRDRETGALARIVEMGTETTFVIEGEKARTVPTHDFNARFEEAPATEREVA